MINVRHYQTQNLAYTMVMKMTECLCLINTNVAYEFLMDMALLPINIKVIFD